MISAWLKTVIAVSAGAICFVPGELRAEVESPAKSTTHPTATIHWQRVPLRETVLRLNDLFGDVVFVDRRIDPNRRVTLDRESSSAKEIAEAISTSLDLDAAEVGKVIYLAPKGTGAKLQAVAAAHRKEALQLPPDLRRLTTTRQTVAWPRLGEPRALVSTLVEQRGWHLANPDAIPHDLWAAGKLPSLPLADDLSLLLFGFDLTFEFVPDGRQIRIVPIKPGGLAPVSSAGSKTTATSPPRKASQQNVKHVYTLRVQEQPVRAILAQLSKRLGWAIQIDEDAIQKAGKSLDTRVSFAVQNADQQHLLDAILKPAQLDYQIEGDQIRIIPHRYGNK